MKPPAVRMQTWRTNFRMILVYDIGRWGQFQDTDEAAYYEFLCKRAGIQVHYCAEPFVNDETVRYAHQKGREFSCAYSYPQPPIDLA